MDMKEAMPGRVPMAAGGASPMLTPELRRHCQARKASMIAEREPMIPVWKQVSEYIDPTRGRFDSGDDRKSAAKRSRAKIINSRATRGLRVMTSGFMGGHTSKARPWFRITVPNPQLAELTSVKVWCDDVAQRIRDVLERSNFYTALPTFYTERHLFGVSAMACVEDDVEVVRFYPFTCGTYAIGLDQRNKVDSFWRCYKASARQLEQRYGEANLPVRVQDALSNNRRDELFTVESIVEPNPEGLQGYQARMKRPFRQIEWVQGSDSDPHGCLDWSGHYENPILASRWGAVADDVYSTAPAIDALPDIKQLQYLEGEKLRLLDLTSKPTLEAPESLRNKGVNSNPGGVVYVTPLQTGGRVQPIYTPDPRAFQFTTEEIRECELRIDDMFFVNLFLMLDSMDDRERTAYEISERKEEKTAMLGPALESLTDEVLDPAISRVYGIMARNGLLPPPPEQLNNVPLRIEYTSMLAQAQKAVGTGTIERVIQFTAGLAQAKQDPSVWDKIDTDQSIDEVSDRQGAPARIVRSDDQVAAIRQGRAQQQRMAQMAQMAEPMAKAAQAMKTMGEAVPQEGSAGEAMAQQGMPA